MDKAHRAFRMEKTLILVSFALALTACGSGSGSGGRGGGPGGGGSASDTYTIAWNAPSNSANVTGFRIYYSTAPINGSGTVRSMDVPSAATNSVSFQPSAHGIAPGSTLYLAVASIGANGLESPISSQASIRLQ